MDNKKKSQFSDATPCGDKLFAPSTPTPDYMAYPFGLFSYSIEVLRDVPCQQTDFYKVLKCHEKKKRNFSG